MVFSGPFGSQPALFPPRIADDLYFLGFIVFELASYPRCQRVFSEPLRPFSLSKSQNHKRQSLSWPTAASPGGPALLHFSYLSSVIIRFFFALMPFPALPLSPLFDVFQTILDALAPCLPLMTRRKVRTNTSLVARPC